MDMVANRLGDGRRLRALTAIDLHTRECVAIDVGHDVVHMLDRWRFERGLSARLSCDNGSEFVGASMDLWACTFGLILDVSRLGKPTDDATNESLNGRRRRLTPQVARKSRCSHPSTEFTQQMA